ncbi:MAG: hypothetical protein K0Q85_789 [Caproiciproducens sp.]|nr:hypothetical protein [Caproiciproducens sp.]
MPRGFKCRRVCAIPDNLMFTPQKPCDGTVALTIEELETVRLCDLEGLEQDEAAISMNVSRATFQRVLYQARKKIADALCTGKGIIIGGGNYELAEHPCGCRKACKNCRFEKQV